MPFFQGQYLLFSGLIVSCLSQTSAAGRNDGYTYGQAMPVTCLNRTIDSGEHIIDDLGKLQYIPFPTCSETSLPLTLHYGVTESLNCTIVSLPDELYHLFEYYVHSDVPMTCRVPTAPLLSALSPESKPPPGEPIEDRKEQETSLTTQENDGPPYTPITFALQGSLQRSHLHIWTDMNVIAHNIPNPSSSSSKRKKGSSGPQGYIVAGTAYSVPEFDALPLLQDGSGSEKEASVVAEAARDPWTFGHGTKVIRGEPLTFTFHVSWIEGGKGIGWPSRDTSPSSVSSSVGAFFSKLLFFSLAASVGAVVTLYWERNGGWRRRSGWRSDGGILGVPSLGGKGVMGLGGMGGGAGGVGISFGNGGKMNGGGYGGYSTGGNGGYGGFSSGKRD